MSVPQQVLSDALSAEINGRRIVAAVFTTYTFDPEFFELEVLPILFDTSFSHVAKVRRVQLEECLRSSGEVAVYYDRRGLVGDARSATLDFRRIDVRKPTGIFHPKLALVLVENPTADEDEEPARSLVVATLSANLTRSGWWESVEAGHIEVIDASAPGNRSCSFRRDLMDLLSVVANTADDEDELGALEEIRRFLRFKAPTREPSVTSTNGYLYTRLFAGQKPLATWLKELRLDRWKWNLEIISPFFDGHGGGALKELVEAIEPRAVRVFLPTDPDGTPTITDDQYKSIAEIAEWGRMPGGITSGGARKATKGAVPRRVHAKVYRFWNRDEGEVVLVGSVNLTQPAHSRANAGNLEAAFLIDISDQPTGGRWWLDPLKDPPKVFAEQTSTEDRDAERVCLDLTLRYDWQRAALDYRVDEDYAGDVEVTAIAGTPLFRILKPKAGEWRSCGEQAAESVKQLLASTSFVMARVPEGEWRVLLREEGMTHKPSLVDRLTPEEILQYWSLLSPSQRQAFLIERLEEGEALQGLTVPGHVRAAGDTLFDRFAGIFHAFEHLQRWIEEKLESERYTEATSRVFGEKYDSMPVLLRKTLERHDGDAVLRYVTFLSARQVAQQLKSDWPEYWAAHPDDALRLEELLDEVASIRDELPLEDADREKFLEWYEEMFLAETSDLEEVPA